MNITKTKTKYKDLSLGDKVEIVSECVDFTFFKKETKGKIHKLSDNYLGVIVKFDDGSTFNFHPNNLKIIKKIKKNEVEVPMGVSQWRKHGIKYGYDTFFDIKF